MSSRRIEKVSALLQREISNLLNQDLVENYGIITVSSVEVTADLKDAKIYISVLNQENENLVLEKLERSRVQYQKILGRKLKLRQTPRLEYLIDHFQEKVNNVEKLLKEINHGS